ncbi:MAG TPA: PfkB family carbohydrate kinase [Methylomirabilota bacterium]|nr:PfkB family carbohydrate kinase [Methylomirabilota bacterium]
MSAPDFVAVGHVTLDRFGDVTRPGGAALFAAVTAQRLGLSAGVLTSHAADFPLDLLPPQIEVVSLDAPATTVFEHRQHAGRRALRLLSAGAPQAAADVPEDWGDAGLVMLAPVAGEVDPQLVEAFPDATLAAEGQGWLRAAGPDGAIGPRPWAPPRGLLERLQALFLSAEDVRGQEPAMLEWLQRLPIAVLTAGSAGALLYVNGERYEVRPRPARVVDVTGAGDVFAATFLLRYHLDGDPWDAAAAAACAASLSLQATGWDAVPDHAALKAALAEYRAAV